MPQRLSDPVEAQLWHKNGLLLQQRSAEQHCSLPFAGVADHWEVSLDLYAVQEAPFHVCSSCCRLVEEPDNLKGGLMLLLAPFSHDELLQVGHTTTCKGTARITGMGLQSPVC